MPQARQLKSGYFEETTHTSEAPEVPRAEAETISSRGKTSRRGKAPPVDPYTGEDPEIRFEDWLPALNRAATWNEWSEGEKLIQLAGHLRGRALQEWNLLDGSECDTWKKATEAIKARLDQGTKVLAAQDFRHTTQKEFETVTDFICRLERAFRIAYGVDPISKETREAFLYGQLQEGLRQELMRSSAVYGARSYPELMMAAKNEEQRQKELQKRKQYRTFSPSKPQAGKGEALTSKMSSDSGKANSYSKRVDKGPCNNCGRMGHFAKQCRLKKSESKGSRASTQDKQATRQIVSEKEGDHPLDYLYSESEEEGCVDLVRVPDRGSCSRRATVEVQGLQAQGTIDSGSDLTIMNGDLFKKVAEFARLKKQDFRPTDKKPRTYSGQQFELDGRMDLDISFDGHAMCTPVYIKMDAKEPLLLSEGVCSQLKIISYHPQVTTPVVAAKKRSSTVGIVPMVRIQLVRSSKLLPQSSHRVPVRLSSAGLLCEGPMLVEGDVGLGQDGVWMQEGLVQPEQGADLLVTLENHSGFTMTVEEGTVIGHADPIEVIPKENQADNVVRQIFTPSKSEAWRWKKLHGLFAETVALSGEDKRRFMSLLEEQHLAFALEDVERGETQAIAMEINTGDCIPKKQHPRRLPMALQEEVDYQVERMLKTGIIQHSKSPWASPIVLVRKRDGTHRFCIDYRQLNQVTKPDAFPLPRIDDLLDKLGGAKFFSTLDLASGYWQIRMEARSQEKTAFITHKGLHEFRVMPFGLRNAPAAFQRLMQEVLSDLNPSDGCGFVSVYIDDILVYSKSLPEHLEHLRQVLSRLKKFNLKLRPDKCSFIQQEVRFLGHVLTPGGLQPSQDHITSVQEFKPPQNVQEIRRFLGLASYYRRFIPGFAKIASPLHSLTRKDVSFEWTSECQKALDTLKDKLVKSPVLSYPQSDREYVLETDASVMGLGAVLSQLQEDQKLHPVAYASRALSSSEKNYGITDLETLAVVWAMSHFRSYVYGQDVTVITDHSAVRPILQKPTSGGKHVRWWLKIQDCGARTLEVKYRPGRENSKADALSRNPTGEAVEEEELPLLGLIISDSSDAPPGTAQPVIDLNSEQRKDPYLFQVIQYLESGILPDDAKIDRKIVAESDLFALVEGILYYIDPKRGHKKRAAVPSHLVQQVLDSMHSGPFSGHFSGLKMYDTLVRSWWWPGMYVKTMSYCQSCPQCCAVRGGTKMNKPPLQPIPVSRPFQILGIDIMDLPKTGKGNKHVLVLQDFLTKWPWVIPMSDQRTITIVRALMEHVIPVAGIPEALLSDRGTNLLSFLMKDICEKLGIEKLNTTAHHPQCDGMTERFNRTLKTMLRKHAALYGNQWDEYLHGAVWAYRNSPHDSTGEKPSFLLFGEELRYPTEAAFLPSRELKPIEVDDYRETLVVLLSNARKMAAESIQQAQKKYKAQYDRKNHTAANSLKKGEWILIRFPAEETGAQRKLSRPWFGPYRVVEVTDTGVIAQRVYTSKKDTIQVHLNRVTRCPPQFPSCHYWYGDRRYGPGRPPKWTESLEPVQSSDSDVTNEQVTSEEHEELATTRDEPAEENVLPVVEKPQKRQKLPEPTLDPSPGRKTRTRTVRPPNYFHQSELGSSSLKKGGVCKKD